MHLESIAIISLMSDFVPIGVILVSLVGGNDRVAQIQHHPAGQRESVYRRSGVES